MLQRCQVGSCPVRSPVKSRIFDVTAVNTSGHIPACLAPRQPCLKIPPTSKFLHHFSPAFVRMTWTLYAYAIILIPLGACDYQCRSAKKSIRRSNHFKWQPFRTKSWNYFRFDLTKKKNRSAVTSNVSHCKAGRTLMNCCPSNTSYTRVQEESFDFKMMAKCGIRHVLRATMLFADLIVAKNGKLNQMPKLVVQLFAMLVHFL